MYTPDNVECLKLKQESGVIKENAANVSVSVIARVAQTDCDWPSAEWGILDGSSSPDTTPV